MKTIKEMLSSKFCILFLFMIAIFFILYVRDVNAEERTQFPDLTSQYNDLKAYIEENPKYVEILKHLIERMDEVGNPYFIYLKEHNAQQYQVYISVGQEEYNINCDAEGNILYTIRVTLMGNATIYMNGGNYNQPSYDLFYLDVNAGETELTMENVDIWVNNFITHKDLMFSRNVGRLPFAWTINNYGDHIFLYSNMKNFKIENVPEEYKIIRVNDYFMLDGMLPKFTSAFPELKIYEELPPDFDYKDMPDISTDGEEQEFDTTDPEKIIEGNDFKKSILNLVSFFLDQFPVYKQIRTISERWRYYDSDCIKLGNMNEPYTKRCLVLDNLKFTFLGHEYDLAGLDVTWYLKYRNTIDFFIKLSVGIFTVLKCLRIIQGMFHGK